MSEYIISTTNMPEHVRETLNAWCDVSGEIVRCRDCAYSSLSFDETRTTCRLWAINDYDDSNSSHGYTLYPCVKPDGFCAWGERKEVEQ